MSLFDIFSFKKNLVAVANADNFTKIRSVIKTAIIEQIKANIPGEEKMDNVVDIAIDFIDDYIYSSNKYVQWLIDNVLIKGIRLLAQSIYEDLKEIIEGL